MIRAFRLLAKKIQDRISIGYLNRKWLGFLSDYSEHQEIVNRNDYRFSIMKSLLSVQV